MAIETQTAEPTAAVEAPRTSRSDSLPFRPLTGRGLLGWGLAAMAAFHVAYELFPPVILIFLLCMFHLGHTASRPLAMYSGWLLGLAIYGPQLAFFWNIFSFGALGLWLVLATWLSVYLVLQRFALLKLGPALGAVAAPFLWTGIEYFRSELYYLRFSWVSVGYAFSPFPQNAIVPWLGMYGVAFLFMLLAAHFPFYGRTSPRRKWAWTVGLAAMTIAGFLLNGNSRVAEGASAQPLKLAGVQLEFPDEQTSLKNSTSCSRDLRTRISTF